MKQDNPTTTAQPSCLLFLLAMAVGPVAGAGAVSCLDFETAILGFVVGSVSVPGAIYGVVKLTSADESSTRRILSQFFLITGGFALLAGPPLLLPAIVATLTGKDIHGEGQYLAVLGTSIVASMAGSLAYLILIVKIRRSTGR